MIQPQFDAQMAAVLSYGIEQFGARAAYDFYTRVMNSIIALPSMPDVHPKNRFIESSERKTYRNILIEKYAVLYSVTSRTIRVLTIYHQAINPQKIKQIS